jgi:hypothetical protein
MPKIKRKIQFKVLLSGNLKKAQLRKFKVPPSGNLKNPRSGILKTFMLRKFKVPRSGNLKKSTLRKFKEIHAQEIFRSNCAVSEYGFLHRSLYIYMQQKQGDKRN